MLVGAGSILSVSYIDPDGNTVYIGPTAWRLVDGFLMPAIGAEWPAIYDLPDAVRIRYIIAGDCPGSVRAALLLLVGSLYNNREQEGEQRLNSLAFGVEKLLWLSRVNIGV